MGAMMRTIIRERLSKGELKYLGRLEPVKVIAR